MEFTALETALTTVQANALGAIESAAPLAIAIMGAILVWRIGIRFFKQFAK